MTDTNARLDRVEVRLGSVEQNVTGLREEVGGLRGEVGGLRGDVATLAGSVKTLEGRVDTLSADVQKLRVLGEENTSTLRLVLDVQADHGRRLDEHGRVLEEIKMAVAPMADLRDFVARVVHDHEHRITALEKHTGLA